jgi:surface antigen
MSARFSTADDSVYEAFARHDDVVGNYASNEFFPGERIGGPRSNGRRAKMLALFLLASATGAAWYGGLSPMAAFALLRDQAALWQAPAAETSAVTPTVRADDTPAVQPLSSSDVAAAPPVGGVAVEVPKVAEPGNAKAAAAEPDAPSESAAPESAALETSSNSETSKPEPLTPPKADPKDPLQKRALAAGLHPDLSHVLLARMSAADYKNAGVAIKTALAETPKGETFSWPKALKGETALFEIHFVESALADCRRYVVAVTKDGWLTTAPPMEKCGLKAPEQHAQAKPAMPPVAPAAKSK